MAISIQRESQPLSLSSHTGLYLKNPLVFLQRSSLICAIMSSSHFESMPNDILQHIAVLCGYTSGWRPPQDILRLLLTSRRLYDALSFQARPEVYAQIFEAKFDLAAPRRRLPPLRTYSLASEFVHRFKVLRRVRHSEVSDHHIQSDLWTLYLMQLESDGLNEKQLAAAGAFYFAVECIRRYIYPHAAITQLDQSQLDHVRSLSVWLLYLTASPRQLLSASSNPYYSRDSQKRSAGSRRHCETNSLF
jgi:hypothetical protein